MALKFHSQKVITREAMEDSFPFILKELGLELLDEARPDWPSVVITIEAAQAVDGWTVRLTCQGGTRDCKVRGG